MVEIDPDEALLIRRQLIRGRFAELGYVQQVQIAVRLGLLPGRLLGRVTEARAQLLRSIDAADAWEEALPLIEQAEEGTPV